MVGKKPKERLEPPEGPPVYEPPVSEPPVVEVLPEPLTPSQEARRLLIQKNMAKSERGRLLGIANRVKKAASLPSPPLAATSHPAHALPVNVSSGMFDSLREEDMSQEQVTLVNKLLGF